MRRRYWMLAVGFVLLAALLPAASPVHAQDDSSPGVNNGNYNIQQSIEMGGRITSRVGSAPVYDTFVNLNSGFRLYNETLSMRSLNHQGLLFDNLYLSNFGYGGDPNNYTRLRIYKNKWYDFSGSFRRDVNAWNYNLLANPLNPTSSSPGLIVTNSLHAFATVRRTSDFRLTLLPQSRVRLRLGYSRNVSEGPSFSSIHEGTETQLVQNWKTTQNNYQIGVDFHLLPRTNFSYDQFLNYYKGDTYWTDQNFGTYTLLNGATSVPVDLGVVFNTGFTGSAGQPCAAPVTPAGSTNVNPSCNAYLAYARNANPRTSLPTEQFSLESSYVHNLNVAARAIYSAADDNVLRYEERFNGALSRTLQRGQITSGSMGSRRVTTTVDLAATYFVSSQFRIVDEFRFNNFRIPGAFNFTLLQQFPQAATTGTTAGNLLLLPVATFNAATCPAPYTATTCPQHTSSSGADLATGTNVRFLGDDSKYNTSRLEYDFTRRFGGSLGFRYGRRNIADYNATVYSAETYAPGPTASSARRGDCVVAANCTANADGSYTFAGLAASSDTARNPFSISEYSGLFGLWARPLDALRINFDLELFSSNHAFTRVSPRNLQHYKARTTYRPRNWMSLTATLNILENRDNVPTVGNVQHNRNYGFSATLAPAQRFDLDFGYEYNDVFSMSNICFASGAVPTGTSPCPISGGGPTLGISEYKSKSNFGYMNLQFKPVPRVTTTLGYSVNSVTGNAPILDPTTGLPLTLNPLAPSGSLNYNYHRPSASLAVELHKNVTGKAAWGYHEYGEHGPLDISGTGPRSFHANLVDLTLRYAF